MPQLDLSERIPPEAKWIKVHYQIRALQPGADLIARIWSGVMDDAVVLKGSAGEVILKLGEPQTLSYQRPVTVDLSLKVVAYRTEE